ncbi:MAG: hypothetical protein V1780_02925 [Chloroflexota bacterium]
MNDLHPLVREFILFCVRRRGGEWPAIYDEMCWVTGQRLFRGLEYADIKGLGLSLALTSLDQTVNMVASAIRPVASSLPIG